MASREIIALNETTPQLLAPQTGDNYLAPRKILVTPEVNTNALAVTGYSLTGSNASSLLDLAGTWNTSGNPVALKIALTNTASGATSKFVSFLAGASGTTEVFSVSKAGDVVAAGLNMSNGGINQFFSAKAIDSGYFGFATDDTRLYRIAAGILGVRGGGTTTGAVLSFVEQTAPSAPAANGCYVYAVDNGAGKTQLMALFASGAAQQLAIEP